MAPGSSQLATAANVPYPAGVRVHRVRQQQSLFGLAPFPERVKRYPQLRYMGSKYKLLPWLHQILSGIDFETALDAFSGSGCVAYLLKGMGKQVVANDFLDFAHHIAVGTVENDREQVSAGTLERLMAPSTRRDDFVERTFSGIFFEPADLRFLDEIWANLPAVTSRYERSMVLAALVRSCIKRQPRGVFTVADPGRYLDGRRDLRLGLREHFLESVAVYNATLFANGGRCRAVRGDVFDVSPKGLDLVYMDPPYVPRADDNCYVKRYHFLEGLVSYWQGEGTEILPDTKVKKIAKRYTPFSYRRTAVDAFDALFRHFRQSTLVLSYSSNGYPDLEQLIELMSHYKAEIEVFEREHRYHFGTHKNVAQDRVSVREYVIVGR